MPDLLQASASRVPRQRVIRFFALSIFLPWVIQACRYMYILFRCLSIRNDVAYPEFASVYSFVYAAHTGKIYADPFLLPLNAQIYGPAFYVVGTVLARLAHGDLQKTAEFGRLLSLVSFYGTAACVAAVAYRLEGRRRWAVVVLSLALACGWGMPLFASVRPDAPAVCFGVVAFTVYMFHEGSPRRIFLAGVLASLAVLTKQTMVCVSIALLLDTVLARRTGHVAAFAVGSLPLPAALIGTLMLRGEDVSKSLFSIGSGQVLWKMCLPALHEAVRGNNCVVVLTVAAVGAVVVWRDPRYRPVGLLCVFSWVLGVAALANVGAATNHLMLPWYSMLFLVPAGMIALETWMSRSGPSFFWFVILCTSFLVYRETKLLVRYPQMWLVPAPPSLQPEAVLGHTMLSDIPYLEAYSARPQMLDPFFYTDLYQVHRWDPALVARQIQNEEYDLLLFGVYRIGSQKYIIHSYRGVPYLPAALVNQINEHYTMRCLIGSSAVFVPKGRASNLDWALVDQIVHRPCGTMTGALVTEAR